MTKRTDFHWRREGDVLRDRIVCPRCGANSTNSKRAKGTVRCSCSMPGACFSDEGNGLVWRRSPCVEAKCSCGWTGKMRSVAYERAYGASRCPVAQDGVHDVVALVYRNEEPGALTVRLRCKQCGAKGHVTVDPVTGLAWEFGG